MKKGIIISMIFTIVMLVSFISVIASENPREKPVAMTTSLSGTILDGKTGESLVGVSVKIEGCELEAYTDFDGVFNFDGIMPGEYTISATMISYKKESSKFVVKLHNDNRIKLNLKSVSQK